ncbi:MAG TPA: hypothetical protein PK819_07045, partial [Thermomicrobiales bacterium]|nr:hypothetical protein [Thermomicrobiales bacterium]
MPSTRKPRSAAPPGADDSTGDRSPTKRTKVAHQTYLVGRTVYLRGLELADAATVALWSDSPFPRSTDVVEDQLKEDVPQDSTSGTRRLVICRRADDSPIGSMEMYSEDGHTSDITPFVSALFTDAYRMSVLAEV